MKKKLIKTVFSVIFSVVLLLLPIISVGADYYISDTVIDKGDYVFGYYNKNIHWSVTRSKQILQITGEGEFHYTHHIQPYGEFIRYLQIDKGITAIKEGALADLPIERISFPDGFERIESGAFANCKSIKKLVIPSDISYIGSGAFSGCDSLESVYIYSENIVIDEGAFPDTLNLKRVYFYGENIEIKEGNESFSRLLDSSQSNVILPMICSAFVCAIIVATFVICRKIRNKNNKKDRAKSALN